MFELQDVQAFIRRHDIIPFHREGIVSVHTELLTCTIVAVNLECSLHCLLCLVCVSVFIAMLGGTIPDGSAVISMFVLSGLTLMPLARANGFDGRLV